MIRNKKDYKKGWVQTSLEATRQHAEIQSSMQGFGYDEAKLGIADNLLGEVEKWDSLYFEHLGGQKKATRDMKEARREVNTRYLKHRKVARIALEGRSDLWDLLKIEGPRKLSLPEWLGQVKAFYYHYDRAADILKKYNISRSEVDQTIAMIEAIEDYRVQQSLSRSRAQEATQKRDQYSRELDQWMREFMYVAKLALKDSPQYLEALGKTVKGK
ncbi:hypothetical protein OKW21_002111 [Catalinimonas alkaloidigena]|uniref:hypothetical protein n=1 Tax=Catalinimonas alkaloidigena TaxID=1075417 RepID=UPI0024063028|nr:hypothetical protein [Catalinimonas alkaloidigena]MDF9796848.1 hypothetical protein [Catalinimonas alkaloidigena]